MSAKSAPVPFPVRGSCCSEPWELADQIEDAQIRDALEAASRRLEEAVARTRRRLAAERKRQERQRRRRP